VTTFLCENQSLRSNVVTKSLTLRWSSNVTVATRARVGGVTVPVGARRRTPALFGDARETAAAQHGDELAPEVVVEPAVEDGVGTGRTESHEMADGEDEAL